MHVHVPKPIHGWRALAGEVGVIVLGVIIALGAEQLIETLHWRHQARELMTAIREDLAHSAGAFEERTLVQPCIERRMDELGELLLKSRRNGTLPDIGEIGRPPVRPIPDASWSTAMLGGMVLHFAPAERDALSMYHSQAATYQNDVVDEQQMWAALRVVEHAPGRIDSAILADVVGTHARLRFRTFLNGVDAEQLFGAIRAMGIAPDYFITAETPADNVRSAMVALQKKRPICHPLIVDGKPYVARLPA